MGRNVLTLLKAILVGGKPNFPGLAYALDGGALPADGLTMGTLYLGRQGTGKTTSLARHLVDSFKRFPERAIFVLDWSGAISNSILRLLLTAPPTMRTRLLQRVIYDDLGHPQWVLPLPEFSAAYGTSFEEQAQRVTQNLMQLAPELVRDAPFLAGLGLREICPQICRVLTAVHNEDGEPWQMTEAKRLLTDPRLLVNVLRSAGDAAPPEARWFLETVYLKLATQERELRTFALVALLGAIEPREIRARLGYDRPAWTPREAIERGLLVLVDGTRLINRQAAQHYLFTQAYSLIMAELNRRQPANPKDQPVSLVMDEVYSLLSIPGMAEEVGKLAPLYRSRKLQLFAVVQALSQLAPPLRQQIWSIGNMVVFAVASVEEAYELARQLFRYEPTAVKLEAKVATQQPIVEPDRGQYLLIAGWLQRLKHRECILRRFLSEQRLDPLVRYVFQTTTNELAERVPDERLQEVKAALLRQRGVAVRDAVAVIRERERRDESWKRPPQL